MNRSVLALVLLGMFGWQAQAYYAFIPLTKRTPAELVEMRLPKEFKLEEIQVEGDGRTIRLKMKDGRIYTFVLRDID